ncbi:uncharacterized protein LOC129780515 isoform X2 [Toxorhynchites rutilus septentrionalis]|uniref:uncharacterized protein LOC129780515 isoform X2 n=1 Tax=Toxorhynchites rutilus septentrionalis TaxID=329112 RepID=UPI002479080B|nr:uncharacterized protein LOC129780515 isoform X2 [Toxorhynchites rutilus septentrionalis]
MRYAWIVAASALLAFANFVKAQETARNLYSSRYDNLDIDTILSSNRLVNNYVDCLLSRKPCPPEGKDLKRILPEALRTKCGRCSATQKENALKIITTLYNNYPAQYQALRERWDPSGEYHRRFEEYLRGLQFNQISSNNGNSASGASNDRPLPSVGVLTNRFGDVDNVQSTSRPTSPPTTTPRPTTAPPPTVRPTTRPAVRQTTSRIITPRTTTSRLMVTEPPVAAVPLQPQSVPVNRVEVVAQPPQTQAPSTSVITTPNNVIDHFFIPPGQQNGSVGNPNQSPIVGLFNQIGTKLATTADALAGMLRKTVDVIVSSHLQAHQRASRSF